jgi:hypothetical protein
MAGVDNLIGHLAVINGVDKSLIFITIGFGTQVAPTFDGRRFEAGAEVADNNPGVI